jgi:membrane protease YdiL (CAAX protease family)
MRAAPTLVALAEVGLCSGIPTQLAIVAALHAAGYALLTPDGGLSLPFVVALSLLDTAVVVGLMVGLTRAHGESPRELWLGTRPVRREAALGALLVPAVFVLVLLLLGVLRMTAPWLHNVPVNPLEQLAATPGGAAVFALVAILAGGVREELQRAFLFRRFERHLGGARVGIAVLTLGFGLGHFVQGWDAVIGTAVLGYFWLVLYTRRRSVLAPMVSHAGFNALEVLRVAIWGV